MTTTTATFRRRIVLLIMAMIIAMTTVAGPAVSEAFADRKPNTGPFAGSSDNFKRHSNACDHSSPRCVGN
jgi:hypothetical protein